jgi:hypothetical protein
LEDNREHLGNGERAEEAVEPLILDLLPGGERDQRGEQDAPGQRAEIKKLHRARIVGPPTRRRSRSLGGGASERNEDGEDLPAALGVGLAPDEDQRERQAGGGEEQVRPPEGDRSALVE